MRWALDFSHPKQWHFIIEQQKMQDVLNRQEVDGFYLYVYEKPEFFAHDLKDEKGNCDSSQQDYLQDTLDIAQRQALEDFGVPVSSWVQIDTE